MASVEDGVGAVVARLGVGRGAAEGGKGCLLVPHPKARSKQRLAAASEASRMDPLRLVW